MADNFEFFVLRSVLTPTYSLCVGLLRLGEREWFALNHSGISRLPRSFGSSIGGS